MKLTERPSSVVASCGGWKDSLARSSALLETSAAGLLWVQNSARSAGFQTTRRTPRALSSKYWSIYAEHIILVSDSNYHALAAGMPIPICAGPDPVVFKELKLTAFSGYFFPVYVLNEYVV
jgi:hypothetical protein